MGLAAGVPRRRTIIRVNANSFSRMVALLMYEGEVSMQQIIEHTGLARQTVSSWMREMKKNGLVHISNWDRDCCGRPTIRLWSWGQGRDAKQPNKGRKERDRQYRERKRQQKMLRALAGVTKEVDHAANSL